MSRIDTVSGVVLAVLVAVIGGWAVWNYLQNPVIVDCAGPAPLLAGLEAGEWAEDGYGIYEQTTIAWAPPILIREEATASVVTRYWGTRPANVGVQYEGGEWFGSTSLDCPWESDGVVGTTGYGVAPPPAPEAHPNDGPEERALAGTVPIERSAPVLQLETGEVTGPLSNEELQALNDTFGPPQAVQVSAGTRIWTALVLWWPIVLIVTGSAALLFIVRRFRQTPADSDELVSVTSDM